MLLPNLGMGCGMGFPCGIAALGSAFRRKGYKGKERLFSFGGRNCDIDFPAKWKVFSTHAIRLVPYAGQFKANTLGLSDSNFGIPIAKEGLSA
jgi:hypothetical protein